MPLLHLPQASPNLRDATIVRWVAGPGSIVAKGDLLAVADTHDGFLELEAAAPGVLEKILAPAGTTIAVGDALAEFSATGGAATPPTPSSKEAPKMSQPSGLVAPILMPQAGNSMEEGTLLTWSVKVGDSISVGDIVAEIETDKATMEVEAEHAGKVALLVAKEGEIVAVKEPILLLAESEEDAKAWLANHRASGTPTTQATPAAPVAVAAPSAPKPAPPKPPAPRPAAPSIQTPVSGGRPKASPAARRIALETGVSLATVASGSGPGGRILSTDVETVARTRSSAPAVVPAVAPAGPVYTESSELIRRPVTKMRRAIAKNLVASKQTVPHFYVKIKIDAGPLLSFQKAEKAKYKVSINDVVVLAVGRVLHEFPSFRMRMEGDELVENPHSNIGIAVGTEDGLTVPVVMYVEGRSLEDLATETRRVVEAARSGKVEGQGHGVFTISNLGMFGVPEFSAIVNPPESGILAVGAIVEEVIVKDGAMRPGRTMTLTLSADHRVVDGLVAGQFAARLKEVLENPRVMQ